MGIILVVEYTKSVNGGKLHETVNESEAMFAPAVKMDLYMLNHVLLLFGFSLAAAALFGGFYLDIEIWGLLFRGLFRGFFSRCLG